MHFTAGLGIEQQKQEKGLSLKGFSSGRSGPPNPKGLLPVLAAPLPHSRQLKESEKGFSEMINRQTDFNNGIQFIYNNFPSF